MVPTTLIHFAIMLRPSSGSWKQIIIIPTIIYCKLIASLSILRTTKQKKVDGRGEAHNFCRTVLGLLCHLMMHNVTLQACTDMHIKICAGAIIELL